MKIGSTVNILSFIKAIERASSLEEIKRIFVDFLKELDIKLNEIENQLRVMPHIYTKAPEEVEGAEKNDISIYVNDDGGVEIGVFK